MKKTFRRTWWQDRFVTLMVIPERTRTVHKLVVPLFALKLGVVLFSVGLIFTLVIGMDYVHVLSRMSENKRLKGENFRLRRDMQLIRNKVDAMESTMERVRNYAKKLQLMTDPTGKTGKGMPIAPMEGGDWERSPAAKPPKGETHSRSELPRGEEEGGSLADGLGIDSPGEALAGGEGDLAALDRLGADFEAEARPAPNYAASLNERVNLLESASYETELNLSRLQVSMHARSAILQATPSLAPITGWVSSAFGYRRHPYDGSYRFHAGVDIAADIGTPVRATADGMVIFAGYKEGYGKVVVIEHGYGMRTFFAHSSRLFVNPGIPVKRGDKIAEVGNTGRSTGAHLHYEIRKNGVPVNPTSFYGQSRF